MKLEVQALDMSPNGRAANMIVSGFPDADEALWFAADFSKDFDPAEATAVEKDGAYVVEIKREREPMRVDFVEAYAKGWARGASDA